jgi:hypothetical protein
LQDGQEAVVTGLGEVAEVGAGMSAVAEVVIALDELAEQRTFRVLDEA